MHDQELIWRIAGGSGDGIDSTSKNMAKALMRAGLHVFTHRHYPSRIRGGHTFVEVRASPDPVTSRGDGYNFLVVLGDSFARNPREEAIYEDEESAPLRENLDDLREGGIIIYDTGLIDDEAVEEIGLEERAEENDWHVYPIDLRQMAKDVGREVMRNTASVGVTFALLDAETDEVERLLEENMSGDILEDNLEVLENAYEYGQELDADHDLTMPTGGTEGEQVLVSGSHGITFGALDEGCRYISGYPMTPWTEVFTLMSKHLPERDGVAEQVEDEIAAAAAAVGASHAGAKALTGSSGGGFALMSEVIGLAEMTETPIVKLLAMRAGPSTGMPTKPEQADLEFAMYTSQGDSNRVVFAPANERECYEQTRQAFELAYNYHLPAIVIYDQKLQGELRNAPKEFFDREVTAEMPSTLTQEELADAARTGGKFRRYAYDDADHPDGVSPRSIPGQKGGRFLATANEHHPTGHISEDPDNRILQMDNRIGKLDAIREELNQREESNQTYMGPDDAEYGIMTWGSSQGTVKEAIRQLNSEGHSVKGLGVSDMSPFAADEVSAFLDSVEECLVVEMNATGQFRGIVQRELGEYGDKLHSLLKYNGNPFEPGDIVDGFESTINGTEFDRSNAKFVPATGD